jgi:hypothetical protein
MRKNTGGPTTVLFLGSRTGSLFRQPFLADLLKEFTNRDVLSMTPIERFHECYKILENFKRQNLDHDVHAIIRKASQEKQVEVADIYVAELMKQGIFDLIITTNIGNELEDAFRQRNMMGHRDFEIIIPGPDEFLDSRIAKRSPFKIIKASGDVFSMRYSICGYNIGSREFFLDKYPKLKMSLEEVKKQNMVMVGFDYKWDRHLIHTIFPRRAGSLWYVNEEQTTEASPLFSDLQECDAKRLEGFQGGYEPFFAQLCIALSIAPTPPISQMKQQKQKGAENPHSSNNIHHPLFPGQTTPEMELGSALKGDPLLPEHPPYSQHLPLTTTVIKVFYVYSPVDEELRKQIEDQLGLLRQMGLISEWHSEKVIAGTEWAIETRKRWEEAQVILLLVSADFISSNYAVAKEAVERHQAKTATVVPIILRPVDWEGAVFSKLRVLPDNHTPITSWTNRDEALLNVAQGIRKVIEKLMVPQE